jgi:hypothetical protein
MIPPAFVAVSVSFAALRLLFVRSDFAEVATDALDLMIDRWEVPICDGQSDKVLSAVTLFAVSVPSPTLGLASFVTVVTAHLERIPPVFVERASHRQLTDHFCSKLDALLLGLIVRSLLETTLR